MNSHERNVNPGRNSVQGQQFEDYLIDSGLISTDQLEIARRDSEQTGRRLADTLRSAGFVSTSVLREAEGCVQGIKTVKLEGITPQAEALALIPVEKARDLIVFPVAVTYVNGASGNKPNRLVLAMANAHDVVAKDALRIFLDQPFALDIRICETADILRAIDQHYGIELSIDKLLVELDMERNARESDRSAVVDADLSSLKMSGDFRHHSIAPVIRLLDAILSDAVRRQASDVHLEPEQTFLRIRYRLDGVLTQIRSIHKTYWPSMLVRLKVLSGLDLSESRTAQDGSFSQSLCGREMDIRASCFPTVNGECIVLRFLDRDASLRPLSQLGIAPLLSGRLKSLGQKPQGLILVTGPTGSGKSTTLYSLVNEIRCDAINVVTMEDPVEYRLPLVRQCSVNPALKLDFASGIRSILRQDPDVILVGETRDLQTAGMVVRAVLTGHLVLTTLHAYSALGAIARLRELGVDSTQLSGQILALIAQRLVRMLCSACKTPDRQRTAWFAAVGCPECDGIGYRGRCPLIDILEPDSKLNESLATGSTILYPEQDAESDGYKGLADSAMALLDSGITSSDEVERVLGISLMHTALPVRES